MQKLVIQDITQINASTHAIRFGGTKETVTVMDRYLTKQTKQDVYWDESTFHGNGGWIIQLDFLRRISKHFANAERAIVIAERMAAVKQINMLARRR